MKVIFLTNFMNHHQVSLADEFYKILGEHYRYIETMPIPKWLLNSGYPLLDRPYVVRSYENNETQRLSYELINNADVVIIGSAPEKYIKKRLENNKLTFHYSERWFKRGYKALLSPRFWFWLYRNHYKYRNSLSFMLCASAYTASDTNLVGVYKNKCFKWGYFTNIEDLNLKELVLKKLTSKHPVRILWCARFLKFKHPELVVKLAERLKKKGYDFVINMFGSGEELAKTQILSRKLEVDDVVNFCGNLPNKEILQIMREHDIFLFTSDRNEGWGVVLNEAMSSGCAVVGSDQIGSVPFLIQDNVNGMIFKSECLDSLEECVIYLIENPERRIQMSCLAYKTMKEIWSPEIAAQQFLLLVEGIIQERNYDFEFTGPCSIAK